MGTRYTPKEMIAKLISFDTVSRHSNLNLIAFLEDYLDGWGVPHSRVENEEGTKANLLATLGPADIEGGIVLSGHTDVVPVDGQDWTTDPFTLREADNRLYGRGTCDMKSFFAIALALVPDFLERGLSVPIHFALSYDEEIGCLGVRPLIDEAVRHLPRPQIVIVGEPTDMLVVNAHKSIDAFTTTVRGLEAHSSATNEGVNAVMIAAEMIHFISQIADEMKLKGDPTGRFEPPYTSVHVGMIHGGTALNIIPKECSFEWEFRALPGQDPQEIIGKVNRFAETVLLPKNARSLSRCQHRNGTWCPCATVDSGRRVAWRDVGFETCGTERNPRRFLWNGSGALPACRHSHRHLRPRQYSAGA